MKFEEKLIKLRKEKLLSQEELGEKLDVTRQTISKWELGQSKPDMEKLKEISTLFNISIEELTNDEIDISKKNKGNGNNAVDINAHHTRNFVILGYSAHRHTSFGVINNVQQHEKADEGNHGNNEANCLNLHAANSDGLAQQRDIRKAQRTTAEQIVSQIFQ